MPIAAKPQPWQVVAMAAGPVLHQRVLSGVVLHFVGTQRGGQVERLPDTAVQQMHMGRERERRRVVA